ncbi:5829_t:CDS:2, partial [Racocetra persica]
QNDSTFQDESEDTSDSILEYNSDSIFVTPFESSALYNEYSMSSSNLECTTLLYTSESLYSSEPLTLDNPENLTSPPDSFTYSDPPNINFSQNTKKHKSVFATSNKKPKPRKSWVWKHMKKDKFIKKETKCLVLIKKVEKIEPCRETFALLTSTSTLRAYLRTVHHLSEKEILKNAQEEINKKNNRATSRGQLLEQIATMSSTLQNADREIRKDGKKLEALLLNKKELLGLKELISLLEPFTHIICLMGSNTYPTLSLMLPTIATLQEHLFKLEKILTHQKDPKIEGYLATILNPHFKNLKFAPEKFEETKQYLKQK